MKKSHCAAVAAMCIGAGFSVVAAPPPATAPADLTSFADFDPFNPEQFLVLTPREMVSNTAKPANPAMSRNVVTLPTISVSNPGTITQSETATKTATFTVSLSSASKSAVKVKYSTSNGTADAGDDYTAKSGTLTFAPGQKTASVTVTILPETNTKEIGKLETFYLNLSNATGATIKNTKTPVGVELVAPVKVASPPPPRTPVRPPHPIFG